VTLVLLLWRLFGRCLRLLDLWYIHEQLNLDFFNVDWHRARANHDVPDRGFIGLSFLRSFFILAFEFVKFASQGLIAGFQLLVLLLRP